MALEEAGYRISALEQQLSVALSSRERAECDAQDLELDLERAQFKIRGLKLTQTSLRSQLYTSLESAVSLDQRELAIARLNAEVGAPVCI